MANSILSPVSLTSFFDNATGAARQANLFFYKAQTLDPITVYTDSLLRVPFPQPVVTTGWARVPPIYVGEIAAPGYRVRAFDQYQTLIEDLDNLPGAAPDPAEVPPPTPVEDAQLAQTGDLKLAWANHRTLVGWIECDGKTIGNVGSNASGMQSAEAHDLFVWLWENDAHPLSVPPGTPLLPVIPSKGADAQGDWDAGKQITLPDYRSRFIMGLDRFASATGKSESERADDGLWDLQPGSPTTPEEAKIYQKPWQIGAAGGEDVHQLVVTELAVHLHDWTDTVGHTHRAGDPGHIHGARSTDTHSHLTPWSRISSAYGAMSGSAFYAGDLARYDATGLATNDVKAGPVTVDPAFTGVVLTHPNYLNSGQPGYGVVNSFVGTWNTTDLKYHNPTLNTPKEASWPTESERGDKPHNTLPPFATACVYIKL